jgi:hypothetical protein
MSAFNRLMGCVIALNPACESGTPPKADLFEIALFRCDHWASFNRRCEAIHQGDMINMVAY